MKSASAPTPMAIIAFVMTKSHKAATNTRRQPMMMIAAWAGRASGVGIGARIVSSKWKTGRYVPIVALTAVADLLVHAKELFVDAIRCLIVVDGEPLECPSVLISEQNKQYGNNRQCKHQTNN